MKNALPEIKELIDLLEEVITVEQIKMLDDLGFFKAPASTNKHLSFRGGLAVHSLNVCKFALKYNEQMNFGLARADIILATTLHDLVKLAYRYEENILKSGNISESKPYITHTVMDLGHGATSVYLAINELGIKLNVQVATAISWHMGFKFPDDQYAVNTIKNQPIDMMLTLLVQHADQWSTYITEHEIKE